MSRDDQHFRLRLPADLREKVEAAAANTRRSLTAEILARLEKTFEPEGELAASKSPSAPQVNFTAVRSPYYADHYLLLLGPVIADYLMAVGQYENFVRNNSDTLLRMDYKNETQRLASRFVARDYMIKIGEKIPEDIEDALLADAERVSSADRSDAETIAKPQKRGRRLDL